MAALRFSTATRIALREIRSSRVKFAFVILSVAIGVGALTGVRGFSASFRRELLLQARSIMAADISVRSTQPLTKDESASLAAIGKSNGVEQTDVTELLSMASSTASFDPLLVALKAVDPAKYPFYGRVELSPNLSLSSALTQDTVAVADDLLIRLHLHVGDSIRLGNHNYRIAATVQQEPDRLSGMFAAGPRVLLSQQALAQSGLLAPESHATRRYLFRMKPTQGKVASDSEVAQLRAQLEQALPEAQVQDYREASPAVTKTLDGATGLLSLMSLVALVLGAVGVAMSMRAHLQQRMESIAIMKSMGATSTQVMKIYVVQTLLLGLAGGIAGALLGLGVQAVFPLFLARLLHITPHFTINAGSVALGIAAGLLTTLLFTVPPLLDIRGVRPILILRRNVEGSDDPFVARLTSKLRSSGAQIIASLALIAGLAALAAAVSDSRAVGGFFAAGLALVLLVLLAMSALTLKLLRIFLRSTGMSLPSSLRHGLANLYRPGNPSAALLAALGLGVMQMGAVYFVQRAVVEEMQISTSARLPNLFLLDISPREVDGLRTLLSSQPSIKGEPEILPVVGSRLIAVDGTPVAQLHFEHMPKRAMQSLNLTWAPQDDAPPPGDTITAGEWWTLAQANDAARHPVIAVEREQARRMHLSIGQHLTLAAQDDQLTATVAAFFDADSRHAYSRASFIMPKASLTGLPVIWYGGVHCEPSQTAMLRRVLYEHYPTVTVIDVAATVETVRQVILQVTYVIQFLAAFSILAGVIILASAIAGKRYRRMREVVVLKTLGGTRARIASIFSWEFAVLGLVSGFVGLVFANILARLLLVHAMHFAYSFHITATLLMWIATAALAVIAGWAASFRILGQKPLEVLREE
ncbi:ABC transporter permease [Granulicella cerasi]|uniref:ABC transporter permease n=1 Tax=Granulicella cerasi TaxID=741063 RepID=A0ABW1ZEC9_9BACT|nr:FtsX-like permease family protein [Granulicella cerasi]